MKRALRERASPRFVVVVGPTASDKSEFAVKLAKKIGGLNRLRRSPENRKSGFLGEIISADSRQVYKYLDIGSAKVPGKWKTLKAKSLKLKAFIYKDIPHYCIDFVNPKKRFTVAEWKNCAEKAVKDIQSRGKIPIICGGSYFYIDAILSGNKFPEVPPDEKLRKKLERLSTARLFLRLKKLDPRRAAKIDPKNKRRLVRALEIIIKTGKPVPFGTDAPPHLRSSQDLKIINLEIPAKKLKKRIEKRLEERLGNGLIEEVKNLHKRHKLSWKRLDEFGLEFRYVSRYLRGLISYDEMKSKINSETWRYAKKQEKWFKRYST